MAPDHTAPTRRAVFPTARTHPPGELQLRALDTAEALTLELSAAHATVGRSRLADLVVPHRSISGVHFELRALDDGVELRDLDSTNGLWFGERRVSTVCLRSGDMFRAGSCRFMLARVATRTLDLLDTATFGRLVGESLAMRELYTDIERIGPTPLRVLVLGETGTGKDLTAQTLHSISGRRGALVSLNCSTLSPALAEAKLFGVRKGAFTGADRDQVGVFEAADAGTLFLDEVGELPPAMQAKLLRVLEDGRVARVGEATPSATVDVRVIAATNRDLREAVADGRFREDLYYRLAEASLHLPRLRDRGADVTTLAQLFLAEVNRARGEALEFTDDALAAIGQYPWPGNVRELHSAVQRAAYLQRDGRIDRADLRLGELRSQRSDRVEKLILAGATYDEIHEAVDEMIVTRMYELHGNISGMARAMGKTRDKVRKLLASVGLYEQS